MTESLGDRLRDTADDIRSVADEVPDGDFDEEALAEFEEEYGEVPELPSILRELEQVTRKLAILAEAHEARDEQ